MSILKLLSSSLGVNNEIPNQKLAEEIATTNNSEAIKELVETLQSSKDKKQQSDCIKVLYETGYKKPELIAHDLPVFVQFIKSKNNRLVWGAMIAIASIAKVKPNEVHTSLAEIMQAVDKGSVITKDCGVMILVQLAAQNKTLQRNVFHC
jgi:methionine salvage enolase-phosphatase E1